jgi:hypothetical protein
LWQDQWSQDIDFIDPRVALLRWLAIKRRFIQRLPKLGFLKSLPKEEAK